MQFADIQLKGETPVASAFDDVYFSRHDGLAESRYVFLHHNDLPQRFPRLPGTFFTIGETGFGTGLNFLAAWDAWRQHQNDHPPDAVDNVFSATPRLHFISTEKFPVRPDQLATLLQPLRAQLPLMEELLAQYRWLVPGWNRFSFTDAELSLYIGDATAGFEDCRALVDAWFLDGFAPSKNPDLWQPALFSALARLSHADTTVSTFTAARIVRDSLGASGFAIERVAGHGRKRHMIRGRFIGFEGPAPFNRHRFWWPRPKPTTLQQATESQPIALIGSGLAAAELAARLRQRGYPVQVIAPDLPGSAASGNDQGAVYAKPGLEADPATCWYAQAMSYRFRQWHARGQHWPGARTGLLHLLPEQRWLSLRSALPTHPFSELCTAIDADNASKLSGQALRQPALWFADSGWISPRDFSRQQLAELPFIRQSAVAFRRQENRWQIHLADKSVVQAAAIIVAAGHHSADWPQTRWLPLKPVRGQVTSVQGGKAPRTVLCGQSYVTPADAEGRWHFGASFDIGATDDNTTDDDRTANLTALSQIAEPLRVEATAQALTDRAGVRATTPDYLPLAGPVLCQEWLHADPRKQVSPWHDLYEPDFLVMTGLGSKGLTSAALLAEYVVCQLTGEPLPFGRETEARIHASRHWLRHAMKGQTISQQDHP